MFVKPLQIRAVAVIAGAVWINHYKGCLPLVSMVILHGSHTHVTHTSHMGETVKSHGSHMGVTWESHGSHMGVTWHHELYIDLKMVIPDT